MSSFRIGGVSTPLSLNPLRRRRAGAAPPGDAEAPSVPQNLVATEVEQNRQALKAILAGRGIALP